MLDSQREIAKLKQEIGDLKNEKERVDAMKKRLFSIVSHDIKSPLGVLVGFADVLMRHVEETYDTNEDAQLKTINGYLSDGKDRILTILEDLVNWVKIENGSVPYRAQEFDAVALAKETTILLQSKAEKKKILLELSGRDETCYGDPGVYKTIIKNVLDNAIKYSPSEKEVHISISHEGVQTVIEIADQGKGIPTEIQSIIYRANKEKIRPGTSGEQGIGLGLSVVQGFVALNKGKISFMSNENEGTTFKLLFPSSATKDV